MGGTDPLFGPSIGTTTTLRRCQQVPHRTWLLWKSVQYLASRTDSLSAAGAAPSLKTWQCCAADIADDHDRECRYICMESSSRDALLSKG